MHSFFPCIRMLGRLCSQRINSMKTLTPSSVLGDCVVNVLIQWRHTDTLKCAAEPVQSIGKVCVDPCLKGMLQLSLKNIMSKRVEIHFEFLKTIFLLTMYHVVKTNSWQENHWEKSRVTCINPFSSSIVLIELQRLEESFCLFMCQIFPSLVLCEAKAT